MSALIAAGIPSPSQGVWYLGPIPLRAYGIIAAGMIIGVWWTARRYRDRGGNPDTLYDAALWAIPLGVVGARIYHVITSPDAYFGPGGDPMLAFQIWRGGLGIWGGVAFGALGVYIAVKRAGVRLGPIADSLAPALLIAQAIGRWGNWFNQELFGAPTTMPWGLQIDTAHMPAGYPAGTLFHPTFLYECLWNLAAAALIVWLDRRHRFAGGQVFGLYLMPTPPAGAGLRCCASTMRTESWACASMYGRPCSCSHWAYSCSSSPAGLGARRALSLRRLRNTRTKKPKTCRLTPVNPMLTMFRGPA